MTREEFIKLLDDHDWFFNMSDSPYVWMRSDNERKVIEEACKDNPEFEELYKKRGDEIFHPEIK